MSVILDGFRIKLLAMDFNIQPNKNKKGKHGGHASKPNAKKSTSARKITLKDEIPSAIAVRV